MARNGYPHMVLDQYVVQVRQVHRERSDRLGRILNRSDAEAYQRRVRSVIARAFSPRPAKTPLRARVTGKVEMLTYRIEKVTFESRPGCLVTANLYVPHNLRGPAPCVLGTCGHSDAGKACDLYQGFCQRLAQAGFVVLIYDPFSQGERDQYYGSEYRDAIGAGTRAHNMMGKQLELLGENLAMWRAWDGVRALDYLLSRPEVDATRVGLTGNSGGGTMTTWLWAIEDRFTMAAPSCFVTTFLHNLENELPADAEQCPPGVLGGGLEMADFLIAAAPKPVLLLGQNYCFFDRRGLQEAHQDVARFYAAMGADKANVDLFIGPEGHGYSVHNQQAMVAFFCQHAGLPETHVDGAEPLAEEMLYATPRGQVIDAGATPVHQLIAARANELAAERAALDAGALRTALQRRLALSGSRPLPHHRVLRPVRKDGAVLARYAVETQEHIRAILWKRMADPTRPFTLDVEREVNLYLAHVSAEADLDLDGDDLALALQERPPLYALDVRGLGESMPEEQRPGFFQPYGMDYMFHAYGAMLGKSYLGRRVYDVLCTMDLLAQEGAEAIHLYGRGQGAILAVFAALYHPRVASVTLKNGPRSFHEWTQTSNVAWPAADFVYGMLQVCDLPDCLRVLGDRVRSVVEPWDPRMMPYQAPGAVEPR
jgi:dienelactone hydrolase